MEREKMLETSQKTCTIQSSPGVARLQNFVRRS